jgi:uncharacterized protein (TIGR03435 family)
LTVTRDGFKSNGYPSWLMVNGKPAAINGQLPGQARNTVLSRRTMPNGGTYLSRGIWKMSMADVAAILVSAVNRPVLDRTGLTGEFDFHLDYDPNGVTRPGLPTVLEEVGLRLEEARQPVEMWVIDRVEKPTEN